MLAPHADSILRFYNSPEVAARYERARYITACERLLFDTYIKPGMAIPDVGVGGGRTSQYLAPNASRYIGLDYAPEMIQICRRKCPGWEFVEDSVTDLSFFQVSFDAVVMPYNVIDDVLPAEGRRKCLKECYRVLKFGGCLIFSSHNPRAIPVRPEWNAAGARVTANRPAGRGMFSRFTDSILEVRALAGRSFRRSARLLSQFAFHLVRVLGDDCPRKSRMLLTG